jgi:hypothetical protein
MLVRASLLAAMVASALPSVALAQGHQAGEAFVAARVGANLVGNTYRVRQSNAVPGVGVSAGIVLRGNGGGSTMIVRPTIAAVYFFN